MRCATLNRVSGCVCGALVLLAVSVPSGAVEWRGEPAVTVGAGSDSNIRLSPTDPQRAANGSLTAAADVLARDVGFQFHVRPRVRVLRYADDAEADRNDAFATFGLALNDDRQRWTFGGDYSRESTLTSEFGGAGFYGVDTERAERSLNTGWNRVLGPRGDLSFSASTADVEYRDAFASPFNDYRYRVLQGSYQRSTSERSTWQFSASESSLEREFGGPEQTTTEVRVTWSHVFSTALSGEIGFGAYDVDSAGSDADPSASFSFAVTRQGPRWTLRSSGARDVRPEGRGALARADTVTLGVERRFSERLSVGAALRGERLAATGLLADVYERAYSQANLMMNWRVAERVNLSAELYQRAQSSTLTPRADGLGSFVSITYRGRL